MNIKRILSKAEIEWANAKRQERYSWNEIAAALFVSRPTVTNAIQRAGWSTARPKNDLAYTYPEDNDDD